MAVATTPSQDIHGSHRGSNLPPKARLDLEDLARRKTLRRGESLVREGDPVEGFWWIEAGALRIFHLSVDGREFEVGRFGPGQFVASALAFSGGRFPHFIEAADESALLFYPRQSAWERIVSTPSLAAHFLQATSSRCLKLQEQLHVRQSQTLRERLLLHLSQECPKDSGCQVRLRSKKEIAASLGTVPETLSRTLRGLVDEGVIDMEGRSIRILRCQRGCRGERVPSFAPMQATSTA